MKDREFGITYTLQGNLDGLFCGFDLHNVGFNILGRDSPGITQRNHMDLAMSNSDWKFSYQPSDGSADLVKPADASNGIINDPDNPFGQMDDAGETVQQEESDTSSSFDTSQ